MSLEYARALFKERRLGVRLCDPIICTTKAEDASSTARVVWGGLARSHWGILPWYVRRNNGRLYEAATWWLWIVLDKAQARGRICRISGSHGCRILRFPEDAWCLDRDLHTQTELLINITDVCIVKRRNLRNHDLILLYRCRCLNDRTMAFLLSAANDIFRPTCNNSIRGPRLDEPGMIIFYLLSSPCLHIVIHSCGIVAVWRKGAWPWLVHKDQIGWGRDIGNYTDRAYLRARHILLQDRLHE